MSLVNLTLRVSRFNININIKRTESRTSVDAEALGKTEEMIEGAIKRKESYEAEFFQLNSFIN